MRRKIATEAGQRARLGRALAAVAWVALVALVLAPSAFATYGRGLWGGADDKVVTMFGFILIIFFPLLAGLLSLLQWRLDKRKEARKAAEKARVGDAHWHGGW